MSDDESEVSIQRDMDIERSILCCLLNKPELFKSCDVSQHAFAGEFTRQVYSAMNDLDADGSGPDLVLLNHRFRERGIDRRGELSALLNVGAVASRFEWYRAELLKIAYKREAVNAETALLAMAKRGATLDELDSERARLMRRAQDEFCPDDIGMEPESVEAEVRQWYQRLDVEAISLGFTDLDELVGDLYPGMVLTVLARPGIGKSVFGLNITHSWLKLKASWAVMFASLEMSTTLTGDRLIRIMEGWNKQEIRHAMLSGGIPEQYRGLSRDRLAIYSRARQPLEAIESALLAWQRKHGKRIRCVVVDYFQYLRGEKGESPYEKGSRLSRELKEFAKDRGLVLVNLCQVRRGQEGGKGTECPSLEAARDSGTIEENADVVLGMWKPGKTEHEIKFRALKVREGRAELQASLLHDVESGRLLPVPERPKWYAS